MTALKDYVMEEKDATWIDQNRVHLVAKDSYIIVKGNCTLHVQTYLHGQTVSIEYPKVANILKKITNSVGGAENQVQIITIEQGSIVTWYLSAEQAILATTGIGAVVGGVAGYFLKEPLGPMVSEAVGAVLGGALGGGVGLLIGLGIIPVPQIPSLGAAPEESGAPARLGKYQITG